MIDVEVPGMTRYAAPWHERLSGRRVVGLIGAGSLVAMMLLAGCGNSGQQSPTTTPTTPATTSPTTTTSPSAVDKDLNPNGPNLFTPPARVTPPERNP